MAKEYILKKLDEYISGDRVIRQENISFGDERVLVWQKQKYKSPGVNYVVVAGRVISEVHKNDNGLDVVQCESVSEEDRQELSDILREHNFKGCINFN